MTTQQIFLSPPHMGDDELELVKEAFASNYIAPVGPQLTAFEQEFADMVGARHALAVTSGTAALHLALRYAGVGPGDEVLCSSLTFVASVTPILFQGAQPVFIDSDRRSWNMDPALTVQAIEERLARGRAPKAVVAVHLYGQAVDLDPIRQVCDQHRISLIEDAAEALGATYKEKSPGTMGLAGIYSFNGNKIITTSGGGMLVSDDGDLIDKARFWSTQARDDAPHYEHTDYGYNYRMSNVLAAIGRGQLRVLQDRVDKKRQICHFYQERLAGIEGIRFMPEAEFGRCSRWLTCLTIDPERFGADREQVRLALETEKIEARPVWKPMHLQPLFANAEVVGGEVAESLFRCGLCLPSGTTLTEEDLDRIARIILKCRK